ncbi:MAG: LCP family protein [Clostridiales bacterium]|jgi:anionic cell wall polymer biosynthesis LytR-Cps2A-Psr (LCP) family protein|nr:LCP family protein [Clostridiales bacterium]
MDIVGPVVMEIPGDGLHYYDPDQNLTINVPGGVQELDGNLAEGVVRYRATYPGGDLQRIQVQQQFLMELFKQTLNKDTLIKNAPELLATVIQFVDTDFGIEDGPKYLPYISKLSPDMFETHTLPGEADSVFNGEVNISYYMHDPVLCKELFDSILYSNDVQPGVDANEIQIFNGGADPTRYEEIIKNLKAVGHMAVDGGPYEGVISERTRIYTKDGTEDVALGGFFKESVVEEDANISGDVDIVIVVGSGE